ncbi:hypothetical protein [Legionella shakespearei]|uniref:Coiled-coil protein n=1 Tax=Legionella shakespearei DSM 23087 TaxID=1122169 RepID=A0A0W0Z0H8_9GAMM|nr:hypothetical protein [Legionella shakespearei]KTD62414.1 hypothetical protein Lsha_1114 [Legionella shakespearei DSM 23087]
MNPVIVHLRSIFPELPLPAAQHSLHWTFDQQINALGPEFYSKVVPLHLSLNMEYSVLCHQLRHSFSFPDQISHDQAMEQLAAALCLAELLEHTYQHYLIVPREVARLRRQQQVYRDLLTEMGGYTFSPRLPEMKPVSVGWSLTQLIRDNTALANWYRLLVTRSKRVLNFLDLVVTNSPMFHDFVSLLDEYTNPFFAYLAWCFFLPRLITNLFLMVKHTIPWPWMDDKEKALDWYLRFEAQIQRRWFELGNDAVWVFVGLSTCFILTGVLAPLGVYLTLFAFAFDIANSALRAYVELNRLYELQDDYQQMYLEAEDDESREAIKEYQNYLNYRVNFEKLRLGLHLAGTVAVLLAMSLAIPALATNPVLPLIGAVLLILIWIAAFVLTQMLEQYRPDEHLEKPVSVGKTGFFAPKKAPVDEPDPTLFDEEELSGEVQPLMS